MQLPPLQPICEGHFCVSGDVSIASSATIAPGVLLQADPGSRLVVAAGVCIGAGSVVHAHQGMLEIASGATLGPGVLVIDSDIGANACIGANATVWNVEIAADQVVAAGMLMGLEQQALTAAETVTMAETIEPPAEAAEQAIAPPTPTDPILQDPPRSAGVIYGKAGLNRLMGSLFPYRESLNGLPPSSDESDSA